MPIMTFIQFLALEIAKQQIHRIKSVNLSHSSRADVVVLRLSKLASTSNDKVCSVMVDGKALAALVWPARSE